MGLPIAYLMSLGNKLKFDLHDAIRVFAAEERVTALGLYLEGMTDPRAFAEAVNRPRAGQTGRRHQNRSIGDRTEDRAVAHGARGGFGCPGERLFERLGVARVESLEALIEALKVLHVMGPLPGGRIGAMSTSGGDLTLVARRDDRNRSDPAAALR